MVLRAGVPTWFSVAQLGTEFRLNAYTDSIEPAHGKELDERVGLGDAKGAAGYGSPGLAPAQIHLTS